MHVSDMSKAAANEDVSGASASPCSEREELTFNTASPKSKLSSRKRARNGSLDTFIK
jgi:hypothetical protein